MPHFAGFGTDLFFPAGADNLSMLSQIRRKIPSRFPGKRSPQLPEKVRRIKKTTPAQNYQPVNLFRINKINLFLD